MLEVEEVQQILSKYVLKSKSQRLDVRQTVNRKITENVYSPINIPARPTSTRDGWCWKKGWTQAQKGVVNFFAQSTSAYTRNVDSTRCYYVATGGIVPDEFDCVVMKEDVDVQGDNIVLRADVQPQNRQYIREIGSDVKQGELIVAASTVLNAYHVGLLVSCGITEVQVERKELDDDFKVVVMSTGNEVIDAFSSESLEEGQVYDCNREMLQAKLTHLYVEVNDYGIIPDDRDELATALQNASEEADIIITSGSTSVGEKDYLYEVLSKMGTVHVTKVNMMPGKPFLFATLNNGCVVFGLAGNPVSTMVGYEVFIKPFIDKCYNCVVEDNSVVVVAGKGGIMNKDKQRPHYIRVALKKEGELVVATPTANQVSSNVKGLLGVHALVKIPAATTISEGIQVKDVLFIEPDDRMWDNHNPDIVRNAKIGIIIASDRASAGIYEDKSGKAIEKWIQTNFVTSHVVVKVCIPDEPMDLWANLDRLVQIGCTIIFTTGGTGPTYRDVTAQVTGEFLDKELSGFGELMRSKSLKYVPTATLSGQTAGITYKGDYGCFIVNLPGSPNSIFECLDEIKACLPKCVELASGDYVETDPPAFRGKHSKFVK